MHPAPEVRRAERRINMEKEYESIPIEIPGVEVVGEFPVKRFFEGLKNPLVKKYNVKLTAHVFYDGSLPVVCAKGQAAPARLDGGSGEVGA